MDERDDQDDRVARDLDELVAVVRAQAARIDELERRLAATSSTVAPVDEPPSPVEALTEHAAEPARPDRRSLLRNAGLATAGALGGAAVLAQASPAAAAQGTFDGNPGVVGTANPTSGIGVRGDTQTGTAVQGRGLGATGPTIGVEGLVIGTASIAVRGIATDSGSATVGVSGAVASPSGIGVEASNTATSGGGYAVKAMSSGAGGIGVYGQATDPGPAGQDTHATGVYGLSSSDRGYGVVGKAGHATGPCTGVVAQVGSPNGFGLDATNTSLASGANVAARLQAIGPAGTAVSAQATSPNGATVAVKAVAAASTQGTALLGTGGGTGIRVGTSTAATGNAIEVATCSTAIRFLNPNPAPLANPTPGTFTVGDIVYDTSGDLWICTAAGTPGSWRRLGGATTAGALVLLNTPVRVYDSRPGEVPLNSTKGPIQGNTTRVIDTTNNGSGVPAGASGVLCTLTVVNTSANGGFLSLFKNGAATPATSTVNWFAANQVVATTTVTAVDASAQAKVSCPPNSSTNFFIDVIGFYQ